MPRRPEFDFHPAAVDVVDLSSGDVLTTISDPAGISGFQWDPVTDQLIVAKASGEVVWLDPATFVELRSLAAERGPLRLQRKDDLLTYGVITDPAVIDIQTHVVDLSSGELIFSGPPDASPWSIFSPSGRYLTISDDARFIRTYEISTGRELPVIDLGSQWVFVGANLTWDGQRDVLYVAFDSGELREYDPESGEVTRSVALSTPLDTLAASPNGELIAGSGFDPSVQLISTTTMGVVAELAGHETNLDSLLWSADSRRLVTSDYAGGTRVWDLGESSTAAKSIPSISPSVHSFGFLSGGNIFSTTPDGEAMIWDTDLSEPAHQFEAATPNGIAHAVTSEVGNVVALATSPTTLTVIDGSTGDQILNIPTAAGGAYVPIAISHDGNLVATSSPRSQGIGANDPSGHLVIDTRSGAKVVASAERPDILRQAPAAAFSIDGQAVVFLDLAAGALR